mmetsp:Transcript_913/g.2443  ORF Transcript_913/g.2443 Transcript_913/m.2443 type:complete len:544 (-) Transcript_913:136-1767(-)
MWAARRYISVWRGATCSNSYGSMVLRQLSSSVSDPASFYDNTVARYASQPVEVLSLLQMLHYGRNAWADPDKYLLKSARFVQREIPKRLARRLLDLQLLPHIVVTNPHIRRVYECYYNSFNALRSVPPVHTLPENAAFCALLRTHMDEHAPMLDMLATGLREVRSKELVGGALALDAFFDSMLRSRISRRVIGEQHLHLTEKRPGYIGIIAEALSVGDAAEFAAQKTRQVCTETYGAAPEFVVTGDRGATLPYIPEHLDYMLYEVMKNAARAVVEHHSAHSNGSGGPGGPGRSSSLVALPPVVVRICAGRNSPDLTVKVSDQGGGIPRTYQAKVWGYGFTTVGGPPLTDPPPPGGTRSGRGRASQAATATSRLPSGYAAAASTHSHWITYSPAATSTGPWGPHDAPAEVQALSAATDPWHAAAAASATAAAADASAAAMVNGTGQHGLGYGAHAGTAAAAGPGEASGVGVLDMMSGAAGNQRPHMAGLGFGLPLSRLYARYFGGDLALAVIPGYGTDAYLTLRALPVGGEAEWREQFDELPIH